MADDPIDRDRVPSDSSAAKLRGQGIAADMNQELAQRLRAYCDGELPAEERAAFERRLDDDTDLRAAAAFETALRTRVRKVMGEPTAPSALREHVAALRGADAPGATTAEREPSADVVGRVDSPSSRAPRMNLLATAASIALIAGAVLFGIFGPQIGTRSHVVAPMDVAPVAIFASQEHGRCASDVDAREQKLAWREPRRAAAGLVDHLQASVTVVDLSDLGYEFLGAGLCMVPQAERSGHMLYRRTVGEKAMASVFLVPDKGQCASLPERPGSPWRVMDDHSVCDHDVLCLADGELVWILVCCDPDDQDRVAARIAEAVVGPPRGDVR